MRYQTVLYAGDSFDEKFGWDFGKTILFQSSQHLDITEAMKEFNMTTLPLTTWFATVRCIEGGEIVGEELFDSSIGGDIY